MYFKKIVFVVFAFLSFAISNAQEFKLGKVSIAELEEKVHPSDSSAVAAILYKKGSSHIDYDQVDGFVLITEVEMRIKIYKKEGLSWANQSIVYYIGSADSKENVSISDAVTYNLVNGKIEKTKLKSDGNFNEEVNKYRSNKKITMPNVKVGSVFEYSYKIKTKDIGMIRDWAFQSSIPVNYSEYVSYIPEYFTFNSNQKGYVFPKVTFEKKPISISVASKERTEGGQYNRTSTSFSVDKLEYIENITTYKCTDLAAMKQESYVNNIDNYTSILTQELSVIKYPNSIAKAFSTDWNTVVKTIYEYDNFGSELNKTGYFESDLEGHLDELKTVDEKITFLFNYVKNRVKWDNNYGYGCDKGVRKAYQEKTGNVGEINLMLTAMLRYAGLTANPVLVSTRSNGIAVFPNRNAYNYVIVAVETPTGTIMLDATEKFSAPNILPLRVLNWFGRLIRKDGTSEEVDLMPKSESTNSVIMSYVIDQKGIVSGKIRRQKTAYEALVFRTGNENLKEDSYIEKLENEYGKIEISDYSRNDEKDFIMPVNETMSFLGSNLIETINDKIYVNPMLFFTSSENPFKQEIRLYPVDYAYPLVEKYIINIKVPEGYNVENLPVSNVVNIEDNLGSFKYIANKSENTILLTITMQINSAIIPTEYYSVLKDFYQRIVDKQNEKIVFKKI